MIAMNNDTDCILQNAQICWIFPNRGRYIALMVAVNHGMEAMGFIKSLRPQPRSAITDIKMSKDTAQIEIMQYDNAGMALQQVKHVLVKHRVAEMIQNAIVMMRILLKRSGVTDRTIGRDPWIGNRWLRN